MSNGLLRDAEISSLGSDTASVMSVTKGPSAVLLGIWLAYSVGNIAVVARPDGAVTFAECHEGSNILTTTERRAEDEIQRQLLAFHAQLLAHQEDFPEESRKLLN